MRSLEQAEPPVNGLAAAGVKATCVAQIPLAWFDTPNYQG
jgi:hypothetical protein